MARLLRIENCEECKHYRYTFDEIDDPGWYECGVAEYEHWHDPVGDGIPDWCPLPEAEEGTDDTTE